MRRAYRRGVDSASSKNVRLVAVGVLVISIGVFVASGGYGWMRGDGNVERLLTDTGAVGPIVFVLVMWCTQPLGVPGFVYMAPAGVVWPFPLAIALSWIGNMGASYIAFSFARWFARDWVSARIPDRMRNQYDRVENGGVWPIAVLRLLTGQLPPADWMLGVTKVSTRDFLVGTGIGILPGVVFVVVAGGGILDALAAMPTMARRLVFAGLIVIVIVRRVVLPRRRRGNAPVGGSTGTATPDI